MHLFENKKALSTKCIFPPNYSHLGKQFHIIPGNLHIQIDGKSNNDPIVCKQNIQQGVSPAYCLYSIWEYVAELQGVVIRESWQVSMKDHRGHLALWLAASMCAVHPIQPFISCTETRTVELNYPGMIRRLLWIAGQTQKFRCVFAPRTLFYQ